MTENLTQKLKQLASEAAAPILLAGAFDNPKLDSAKAKAALFKLGIPVSSNILVTFAYDNCGTHNYVKLEEAAKKNGAKLYIVYGDPNEPGLEKPENHDKLSISVTEGVKARKLAADKFILAKDGTRVLSKDELKRIALDLGMSLARDGAGMSTSNSALFENGTFKGIIADGETTIGVPAKSEAVKTSSIPRLKSGFALA